MPEGAQRTATEAAVDLVALLADEGVSHLFFNPGTDTAPVQEALAAARAAGRPRPQSVLCLHESVALSAAIGHHMASGQPQAVMVHVDAGTLNLGAAIHNAQRNRTPVVIFAGRAPYTTATEVRGHRDSPIHWQQEQLDQPGVLRNFGKWHMEVPRGRELAPIVRRAFQVAQAPPSGPAYVMLPREALMEPGSAALPARLRPPVAGGADPAVLKEMAEALAGARHPVIVTSRTGADPETVPVLARIAELLGAAVIDHYERPCLPHAHPLNAGGSGGALLGTADVVLLLDVEVPWVPAAGAPPAGARVLQIDIDCAKASMPLWSYPVEFALNADTRVALPQLEEALCRLATPERQPRWATQRREAEAAVAGIHADWARRAESAAPADAADAVVAAVEEALPDAAIMVEEAVTNRLAVARQSRRTPGTFYNTGSPALGWVLGGAIGVKLARPDVPVVAICGDGSFNFSVPTAALWVARRSAAPFVAVVLNNHSYNASKRPVQGLYPHGASVAADDFPETELSPDTDYALLARACGGEGRKVDSPAEVGDAMRWALAESAQGKCVVLDCQLPSL
jgi:acetolactate synthase-1/2/3 large subunit